MHTIRRALDAALSTLDGLSPWVSLAVVATITAVVMLIVVRRTSPQRLIGHARAQMAAALLEMRLYLDHPLRMLGAQGRMLGWTVVYLACLIPSAIVLAAPLGLLYLHLEPRHGLAAFAAPATVVMRIELGAGVATRDVSIEPSAALIVTAQVRANDERAVYARIAIRWPGTHHVVVRAAGATATKEISADPNASAVAPELRGGLSQLWGLGVEPPPPTDAIRSISLQHAERTGELPVPWWLYWLGLATAVAMALRRRFDVVL